MQVINKAFIYEVIILLGGCTYEYNPDIEGSRSTLIINGKVTDREGYQYIEISRSFAPYDRDIDRPVSAYTVEIQDEKGNSFPGSEMEPGLYACWMEQEYLAPGISYRLIVTSDKGNQYISDFDELLPCPDIDSITHEIQEVASDIPDVYYKGLQFFVNTDCSGEYAKHLRWEMEETWEYHSRYEIRAIYDGRFQDLEDIILDYFKCWQTKKIRNIYTYSTENLSNGQIRHFPLHLVSSQSNRLSMKYSVLVEQQSLGSEAFEYLNILEEQSRQSGELYETQPRQIVGNIRSQEGSGEPVLGLFYATSVKEKRIFVRSPFQTLRPKCEPYGFTLTELIVYLREISTSQYPIYLWWEEVGPALVYDYADQECFDCRLLGGTTERPDFWE